jgi:hypothetical protein
MIRHQLADPRDQFSPNKSGPAGNRGRGSTGWLALAQHYRDGGALDAADALPVELLADCVCRGIAASVTASLSLPRKRGRVGEGARLRRFGRYDLADHQPFVPGTDVNRRTVGDMAFEDLLG